MKHKIIRFKSVEDFHNRIVAIWQDHKEGESCEYQFANEEVEIEFNKLVECFQKVNSAEGS